LLGDANLAECFADRFALGNEDFGFAEMVDDLPCGLLFPGHEDPFRMTQNLNQLLDLFLGIRSE